MKLFLVCGAVLALAANCLEAGDRNRVVRVVSVSQADIDRSDPKMLDETMERLDRAASFRPDIAALPELAVEGLPEKVLEPAMARLSAWAKRHSSYVVFGTKTRVNGRLRNSAVLLDRSGAVAGRYDKIHPTENELKSESIPATPIHLSLKQTLGRSASKSAST